MNDIRTKASALRNHAWLERFRKADGKTNNYHELSPCACNDIARHVDSFITEVEIAVPIGNCEDGWALTIQQMQDAGFKPAANGTNKELHPMSLGILHCWRTPGSFERGDIEWGVALEMSPHSYLHLPKSTFLRTVGDLRRICTSLGITMK